MKIKNSLLFAAGSCLLFLASCQSPRDQLINKWQVESFHNPVKDSVRTAHIKSIDTITYVDSNMAHFFGTANVDSIKSLLKEDLERDKKMEADAAKQTAFDFRKDSTLIVHSGVRVDTFRWTLSEDNKTITVRPLRSDEEGQDFHIASISSNKLQLNLNRGPSTIEIYLRPFTKEDSIAAAKLLQEQLDEQLARQRQMQQMQQQMQQQMEAQQHAAPAEASAQ